jgi:hypothetical protein
MIVCAPRTCSCQSSAQTPKREDKGHHYIIREADRRIVLTGLLELNHARYAEEVKAKGKRGPQAVADEQMALL